MWCHLLITFASRLDPDQARHNVEPDLDPNGFDTLMVFLKEFFEKFDLKKQKQQTTKKHAKFNTQLFQLSFAYSHFKFNILVTVHTYLTLISYQSKTNSMRDLNNTYM